MRSHRSTHAAPNHVVGGYRSWPCAAPARSFDLLWLSRADGVNPSRHRILPTGEPSLAVRRRRGPDGRLEDIELVVCAVYDKPFWYRPAPGEELVALRLKPEVSAGLIGVDPRDFRDIEPVPAPRRLVERMNASLRAAETGDTADIASALIDDVDAITAAAKDNALVARAAAHIRKEQGGVSMRALAFELDVSERHLRRAFKNTVGCSPKTFARRQRLTAAAIAADAADKPDWAQIALEAGFHDQSHLIAEYRALVGQTPAQNHKERRSGSAFSNTPQAA